MKQPEFDPQSNRRSFTECEVCSCLHVSSLLTRQSKLGNGCGTPGFLHKGHQCVERLIWQPSALHLDRMEVMSAHYNGPGTCRAAYTTALTIQQRCSLW